MDGSRVAPQQQLSSRAVGFQRRHSYCPVTLTNSKFFSSDPDGTWDLAVGPQQQWSRELPRSVLSHIPFRGDRSISMIEGGATLSREAPDPLPLPPGLDLNCRPPSGPLISTRYKSELCRTYEESGACKYGAKCQFAHGSDELRGLSRHPRYKTEHCRTFHSIGFCPYGARCHFIHNADELRSAGALSRPRPPQLRHSISFSGFSTALCFQPVDQTGPLLFSRASSVSPPPSTTGTPDLQSPLFPEPGPLRHCSYPFSGLLGLGDNSALHFSAVTDTVCTSPQPPGLRTEQLPGLGPGGHRAGPLQRCSSADSLSEEGYNSSCSLSSSGRSDSPSFEARRLPIFSRLSITDE